jgi:hypothetical protein
MKLGLSISSILILGLGCGDDDAGPRIDAGRADSGPRDGGGGGDEDAGDDVDSGADPDGGEDLDAGDSDGGGSDAGGADAGLDAGASTACPDGLGLDCDDSTPCPAGFECMVGRCTPQSRMICGGFAGAMCTDPVYSSCLYFASADFGPCLTPAEVTCLCAMPRADAYFVCR